MTFVSPTSRDQSKKTANLTTCISDMETAMCPTIDSIQSPAKYSFTTKNNASCIFDPNMKSQPCSFTTESPYLPYVTGGGSEPDLEDEDFLIFLVEGVDRIIWGRHGNGIEYSEQDLINYNYQLYLNNKLLMNDNNNKFVKSKRFSQRKTYTKDKAKGAEKKAGNDYEKAKGAEYNEEKIDIGIEKK